MENCTAVGTVARKRLADISNITQQPKSLSQGGQAIAVSNKQYTEKIQKENMKLVEIIADRNKLIEYTGVELQKSRINMQKLQRQNLQLAQENCKMLGELNSCKDRLKALNHELGCKIGLIKALQPEKKKLAEEKEVGNKLGRSECDEAGETYEPRKVEKSDDQPCNTRRTRQSNYQAILLASASTEVSLTAVAAGTSRKQVEKKRQSARFKPEIPVEAEDVFEVNDAKIPIHAMNDNQRNENTPTPSILAIKEGSNPSSNGAQEFRRSSVGRPLRRAVEKVQSYKEMNLRNKMRKPE